MLERCLIHSCSGGVVIEFGQAEGSEGRSFEEGRAEQQVEGNIRGPSSGVSSGTALPHSLLLADVQKPSRPPGEAPLPPIVPPGMPPVAPPQRALEELVMPFAVPTAGGGFQGRLFNESVEGDLLAAFIAGLSSADKRKSGKSIRGLSGITREMSYASRFSLLWFVEHRRQVLIPVGTCYNGISITDSDSPCPTDRLYYHHSYYDGIAAQLNPGFGNVTLHRPIMALRKPF